MTPTVGRIVHYWPRQDDAQLWQDAAPLAAMINRVHDDHTVSLTVFSCKAQCMPYGCTLRESISILDQVSAMQTHAGSGKATWPVGR